MSAGDTGLGRHVGLFGATLVGIGGIVGGGLLILAGTAFADAGPAAIVAFALNGVVALLTAASIAEISTLFPESGGAYTFAKKVLSVRAAFAVGWVLWFAYIVAAVLYAIGFASFALIAVRGACEGLGIAPPGWLADRNVLLLVGTAAIVLYAAALVRRASGGGRWTTIGKLVVFSALIVAGVVALFRQPFAATTATLDPFWTGGPGGIVAAMGVTFICIQGFEMISAIAGEIRDPEKTIPRAMFLSIIVSSAVYLPLLFVIVTAGGAPGEHVTQLAAKNPDTVVAVSVGRFLGGTGYWFMVVAIALSTLSALQANLLTASRIALAMAHDHTLPAVLEQKHPRRGTPVMAIYATALAVVAILFMMTDLGAAGAAAGLIFLLAFALTHVTTYLARTRIGPRRAAGAYRSPWFPAIPIVGGLACLALAVFQAIAVPDAARVMMIWLGLGVILYFALFKGRAEVADVAAEALDPSLVRLRGKSPLVLLPLANPKNARSLVEVANALAPTEYARVLLLSIVRAPRGGTGDPLAQLADAQDAVRQALTTSYTAGHAPEALITAAAEPWPEIRRIADEHRCESLLIGLPERADPALEAELERLIEELDCDVAAMRAPAEWSIATARRVLVPVGGRGENHELRARLLATLCRELPREIVFVTVVPAAAPEATVAEATRMLTRLAAMKLPVAPAVEVLRGDDIGAAVVAAAAGHDVLVLGLHRSRQGRKTMGDINRMIAFQAPCAVLLLARRATTL
jgi:amino acid transporter